MRVPVVLTYEPISRPISTGRFHRSPAVPVAIAVMVGIVVDKSILSLSLPYWIAGTSCLLLTNVSLWTYQSSFVRSIFLLLSCVGVGAAWHHCCWNCVRDDDVSKWAKEFGQNVRLRGKIVRTPIVLTNRDALSAPWKSSERTITVLDCQRLLRSVDEYELVSGQVRMTIVGRADELSIGDIVDVTGNLFRPSVPANPGDFPIRDWLRSQGLHAIVSVDSPDAIDVLRRERTLSDWIAFIRAEGRRRAERLIEQHVSPTNAPVAQSLLLGSRVDLEPDIRRAFAESGTLHVLAISGMNVGLLWSWVCMVCRGLRVSSRTSLLVVLCLLPLYAALTDANPPIVRATIVAVVMAFGQLVGRGISVWNSLALAALCVLAWNPNDLFNSGAQLSFLSVFAILVSMAFMRSLRQVLVVTDPWATNDSPWR
ncbi:MAG: ComEC family competence protein, partial [Planctomycetes bacterium]|nr:ComEC family competence protein [Planctomycetota bacterium]